MSFAALLLGGLLVVLGVVSGAVADRVRYGKRRTRTAQEIAFNTPLLDAAEKRRDRIGDQVVEALVTAGYKRPAAKGAVWSCGAVDHATLDSWTRAALKNAGAQS